MCHNVSKRQAVSDETARLMGGVPAWSSVPWIIRLFLLQRLATDQHPPRHKRKLEALVLQPWNTLVEFQSNGSGLNPCTLNTAYDLFSSFAHVTRWLLNAVDVSLGFIQNCSCEEFDYADELFSRNTQWTKEWGEELGRARSVKRFVHNKLS